MNSLIRPILDLFSSVRFGVVLLTLLFAYMSVGSAGIIYPIHPNIFHTDAWVHAQMRQWRPFEMTEFEWFHWWPFDVLMALLAITLVTTTVRRIPLRVVNLGVWMIHSGIIMLIVGSVIYFGTKVEGEAPIVRRTVTIGIAAKDGPASELVATGTLLAMPGSKLTVGQGADRYDIEVQSIDPDWELRSGADVGKRAYSVNLMIAAPDRRFMRQVIAGYPEYTEDLIFTQDKAQPVKRAVKETGKPIIDSRLFVALDYCPQTNFYLKNDLEKSWALYVRRPGETRWVERPINGLPLYNDYVPDLDEVFIGTAESAQPRSLRVPIPAESPDDPAPGVVFEATGYIRYGQMRSRLIPGGADAAPNAVASVDVSDTEGRSAQYRLVASDPQKRSADGGVLALRQISDEEQVAGLLSQPTLVFRVPSRSITLTESVKDAALADKDAPWRPIGPVDSGYSYRVVSVQDDLAIGGRELSVAILELRTPTGEFRRWTFSDPTMSRDLQPGEDPMAAMKRGGESFTDASLEVEYRPGNGLALALLVAGPEQGRLRLVDSLGRPEARIVEVLPRTPVELAAGVKLTVTDWMPNAIEESKPFVVPQSQRQRDARELFSMMRLNQVLPTKTALGAASPAAAPSSVPVEWLTYHPYVFDRPQDVLRRYWLTPSTITLADGSSLEVLFSRQREPLPAPVALETFQLTTEVGGFSGQSSSIRNYTSVVRFQQSGGEWSVPERLSVNEPVEYDGMSFFQSQWDPPEEARQGGMASAGLNYTVLGVGNRHGVWVQLLGCIVACIGMIYAFYVKPVIKQRNERLVLEEIARAKAEGRRPSFPKHHSESVHA
jgi:hypothetical protein